MMLHDKYLKVTSHQITLALLTTITLLLLIAPSSSSSQSLETQSCSKAIGQFWDQSQCSPCQTNCGCSTYKGCDYCKDSMYFDTITNKCESCDAKCATCCMRQSLTKVICTTCNTDYTLINGSCVSSIGCETYIPNTNKCRLCKSGFFLDSSLTCIKCDAACATCSTLYDCITCTAGKYYPSPSFPSVCLKCTCGDTCNTSGICVTTPVVPSTDLCPSSIINCNYQLYDFAEKQCKCETCEAGYYVSRSLQSYSCEGCPPNSARCLSSDIVLECASNYILDIATNLCVDNSTLKCRRMFNGNCSDCYDTFYSEADGDVVGCYKIKANCSVNSQKGNVCLTCDKGYYLPASNTCTQCNDTNCSECSSPDGSCTKCKTKYRLNDANQCDQCHDLNCATCAASQDKCTVCDTGYGINTDDPVSKCLKCQTGCDACDEQFRKCTACSEGYYNINFTCVPIPLHCIYELNGFCILCDSTYIARDGYCQQCENSSSGLYFCPSVCKDEEITVLMQLSQSIIKYTMFMLGILLLVGVF